MAVAQDMIGLAVTNAREVPRGKGAYPISRPQAAAGDLIAKRLTHCTQRRERCLLSSSQPGGAG